MSSIGLGCMSMSFGYGPPGDRQEMIALIRTAVDGIDAEVAGRVGAESVAQARAVLVALIEAGGETLE